MNAALRPRHNSGSVSVCAHVDTEVDVRISIEDIVEQLEESDIQILLEAAGRSGNANLTLVYEHFARHGGAPQVLRDYLYDTLGRILP